jgi:hypothetical protein
LNKKRLSILLLLSILVIPPLHPAKALGGVTLTAPTRSSVSVDGVFQAAEWSDGTHLAFNWASNNSTLTNAGDIWVKTNGTYLLIAVGANGRTTANAGPDTYNYTLSILIDNNNNGVINNNEDAKSIGISFPSTGCSGEVYKDLHYSSTQGGYVNDQYTNGTACGSNSNPGASGIWSWEFAMPMQQDPAGQDFNLVQNASIGFDIVYSEQHYRSSALFSSGWAYWQVSYSNGLPTGTSPSANGWGVIVWTNLNAPIVDTTPPTISTPTIKPTSPGYSDTVTVSVNVTDTGSGVKNVSITYTSDNWKTVNKTLTATYNITTSIATAQIPALQSGGHMEYYVTAFDNAGNKGVNNNSGSYFSYDVSPPWYLGTNFWLLVVLGLALAVILFAVIYTKRRKRSTKAASPN